MTPRTAILALCLAAATLLGGCGAPGIPEPPSLELARPVRDLRAARKGNEVHLSWSAPTETTDHRSFRHAGPTKICRSLGRLQDCEISIAEVSTRILVSPGGGGFKLWRKPRAPSAQGPETAYIDQLSASTEMQSPTTDLIYAVSVLNSYGKTAGLSNEAEVPSAPTLAAPVDLNARLTADGVELSWHAVAPAADVPGLRYVYRVYRSSLAAQKATIAGEVPLGDDSKPTLLDTTFQWEKTYDYYVTVATQIERAAGYEEVEGDNSAPVRVFAHDVFPPAIPTGVQAAFSGPGQKPFIDLVWKPDTEMDLAGYNVYRREPDGGEMIKINADLVKAPALRDANVSPGHTYLYSVSAVDVRGNESARSQAASETVPANP
jgi:hypothetical protein